MSQRSPFNDRYKVDQKGKTRKSASAAKPSRSAGANSTATKTPAKKSSAWSRAKSATKSQSSATPRYQLTSPRLKSLTRQMWIGFAIAAGMWLAAFALQWFLPQYKNVATTITVFFYIPLGYTLYLQLGPMRKERKAIEAAYASGKKPGGKTESPKKPSGKSEGSAKSDSSGTSEGDA